MENSRRDTFNKALDILIKGKGKQLFFIESGIDYFYDTLLHENEIALRESKDYNYYELLGLDKYEIKAVKGMLNLDNASVINL